MASSGKLQGTARNWGRATKVDPRSCWKIDTFHFFIGGKLIDSATGRQDLKFKLVDNSIGHTSGSLWPGRGGGGRWGFPLN